jgi:5-methylcytosine-specific restriction endonuclease McrA
MDELLSKLCDTFIDSKKEKETPKRKTLKKSNKTSRYIPKSIKHEALERSKHRCEKCGSRYRLEFDHKIPLSKGGISEASNIRVLCRNCNQREGIKILGLDKMTQYDRSGTGKALQGSLFS